MEDLKDADQQWAAGDDINLVWEFSPRHTHRTSLTSITDSGGGVLDYNVAEPMPHNIPKQEGDGQERYYPCFKPHIYKGDPISLQMSDTSWHDTKISEDANFDYLRMEEGPPGVTDANATFNWWNSR